MKESQYVNEDLPEEKLSNIVSGALDRLHYMTDACVKYDSEKKLWLYLHSDRNYEHPGWGEDGEDYLEKGPSKKKKRDFEWKTSFKEHIFRIKALYLNNF